MKLSTTDTVTAPIATYIGTITNIHWGDGYGTVDLGGTLGEKSCIFRYVGQYWIFNETSYATEDSGSHSAFAFCYGDKVLVVKKRKERPATGYEYVAVAVLKNDLSELDKRYVWPLFRKGHKAVVIGAKYSNNSNQSAGFPFMNTATRALVAPYIDGHGADRAFGTMNGTGNNKLVVTEESGVFIPHPACEFMAESDQFLYVPDVLMQTAPNYKGRIVGISATNELLIDNIPVATIVSSDSAALGSDKAFTHRMVHINEKQGLVTVLDVVMDYEFYWYDTHTFYSGPGFYPPPYGFKVRLATISTAKLCVYDAMGVARENLPVITLQIDTASSWKWDDIIGVPYNTSVAYAAYCYGDIMSTEIKVGVFGEEDVSLSFYAIDPANNPSQGSWVRKISFKLHSQTDGSYSVVKSTGDLEKASTFSSAYSCVERGTTYSNEYSRIASCTADAVHSVLSKVGSAEMSVSLVVDVNTHWAKQNITVYTPPQPDSTGYTYTIDCHSQQNDSIDRIYTHTDEHGSFEIARDVVRVIGNGDYTRIDTFTGGQGVWDYVGSTYNCVDGVRGTCKFIVFTHIDVKRGVYAFWEVTILDDVEMCKAIKSYSAAQSKFWYQPTGKQVKWYHYIMDRSQKILTNTYGVQPPYGYENTTLTGIPLTTRLGFSSFIRDMGYAGAISQGTGKYMNFGYSVVLIDLPNTAVSSDMAYEPTLLPLPTGPTFQDSMVDWLNWTNDCSYYKNGGAFTRSGALYSAYTLHPFTNAVASKQYKWPYFLNQGNPHIGIGIAYAPEEVPFFGTFLYSKGSTVVSGIDVGLGQYKYTFTTLGGTPRVLESNSFTTMALCTGRADMVISID